MTNSAETKVLSAKRAKRFMKPLKTSGIRVEIPESWEALPILPVALHEQVFVSILERRGLPVRSPVPLISRYSKARHWSTEELEACLRAHERGIPVALMSAALNRNPQDIIFRLLDELCEGTGFKEVGLRTRHGWTDDLISAGRELFAAGLTAWRVAALFGLDFEGAEKVLYQGRSDYGHAKKNPFAICTDHKQMVNSAFVRRRSSLETALEAFAGEGRFANVVSEAHPRARLLCIEKDQATFDRAVESRNWGTNVEWRCGDNLQVMADLAARGTKFDLVDLDPFVTCHEQLDLVWKLLADDAALCFTFGGEYRRSFIRTNRKAIQRRYGWINETLSNTEYLETVPSYFLGWVAQQAARNGYTLRLEYCVRYPNNCRFWTIATAASPLERANWLSANVTASEFGYFWKDLRIPRFSEVRSTASEVQWRTGIAKKNETASKSDSYDRLELVM